MTPWTAACQASPSLPISQGLPKFTSVHQWCHLILWPPLLLLSSIYPSITDFSNESTACITWIVFTVMPKQTMQMIRGWVTPLTVLVVLKSAYLICAAKFSCSVVSDPTDCSMPGFPVHHQLPEFTQTHVHWVGDAIQPAHPLSSPSPPAPNPSQNQGLFQWVSSSHQVAKGLEFSFSISPSNEYSGLISFRMDWLDLLAVQETLNSLLQHHSSKASIASVLSFLYSPTLTSIHDYWKNHSFD